MNRRRFRRYTIEGMDVHAKMVFVSKVELLDISTSGACLQTSMNLKIGGRYVIRLEDERNNFTVPFIVVWGKLSGNVETPEGNHVPVYKTGVEFSELPPEKLVKLKDFIRGSGLPNEETVNNDNRTALLRFRIQAHESALINFPVSYTVKKISAGGILVEVNRALQPEKIYPMALSLPDSPEAIRFRGRIASCLEQVDRERPLFDVGIEFVDIAEADRERLNAFLASLGRRDNP